MNRLESACEHFDEGVKVSHLSDCWSATDMDIRGEYAAQLFFPESAFVQVYFEGVANALDAGADAIAIDIFAERVDKLIDIKMSISDNGCGLTDERIERFKSLQPPSDSFHKGLGRLVFLRYFSDVEALSRFGKTERRFELSGNKDQSHIDQALPAATSPGTAVTLKGFLGKRLKSNDEIRPGVLTERLMTEFLPLFHARKTAGKPFRIDVELNTEGITNLIPDSATITLADVPDFKSRAVKYRPNPVEQELPGGVTQSERSLDVQIHYLIEPSSASVTLRSAVVVDHRALEIQLLTAKAIPGGHRAIFLFESSDFVGSTDSARQQLRLPKDIKPDALFGFLRCEVGKLLEEELPFIRARNTATMSGLDDKYPYLIGLFDGEAAGLVDRTEALRRAQDRFFRQQRSVLEGAIENDETFQASLEISSRALTQYVLYRDWIIKKLVATSARDNESVIHNLIVPQRVVLDDHALIDDIYRNNAWLLDDKFMTFRKVLSDMEMTKVMQAITLKEDGPEDDGRPDISMIFSADPSADAKVDVVIVELKRRRADDKDGLYAATQLRKRARKIIDNCPNIQRAWYYGIIEIDDALTQLLLDDDWTPLYSKGKVFFREHSFRHAHDGSAVSVPMFMMSFDAVVHDAEARNHAFLELLRSGFQAAAAAARAVPATDDEAVSLDDGGGLVAADEDDWEV